MKRREFLKIAGAGAVYPLLEGCSAFELQSSSAVNSAKAGKG